MEHSGFDNNENPQRISSGNLIVSFFRLKSIVPLLFGISLFYLIFYTSCANQGMPTGGEKDTIPPYIVKTVPTLRGTNFKGSDLRFTFDEYIVPDEISEKLVISPPMKKKPVIKMKGKTLIIEFAEDLKKETTYSLDFKDAVADNNEK
ncbi:MAG: Ig-like domain-containing protein, partial [Bacteroidota bacterium]|nr:Ig-like domain-containing protein [Bacteroidota bacterium]